MVSTRTTFFTSSAGSEDLPTMSDRLIVMANEAGGDDNTTVVVVALRDELKPDCGSG